MSAVSFNERVDRRIKAIDSTACLGLDSDWNELPESVRIGFPDLDILRFNCSLINATHPMLLAVKANIAFYECHVRGGLEILQRSFAHLKRVAPDVLRILDFKRADIGNTNKGYLNLALAMCADAVTVSPYLGEEALGPFMSAPGNLGVIVLCKTSNPGSNEFQAGKRLLETDQERNFFGIDHVSLHEYVAYRVAHRWQNRANLALVAGATYPAELERIRKIVGDSMTLLIPGLGKQAGDAQKTIEAGQNTRGRGIILNNSRKLIFASTGPDWVQACAAATSEFVTLTNSFRKQAA